MIVDDDPVTDPPLNETESCDHAGRPEDQEHEHGEGPEPAKRVLGDRDSQRPRDTSPGYPRGAIEDSGELKPAAYPARENDGLEGVPQHDHEQNDPHDGNERPHGGKYR